MLIKKGLLYSLSIGVSAYAVVAYLLFPLGDLVHPEMQENFETNNLGIYAHIFSSAIALALGPFQFSTHLRQKYLNLHRWFGRLYLIIGVLIGGLSGLYMSLFAFGGVIAKSGFGVLAILWLYTGLRAYLEARRRDIIEHKKWMVRNFSLTLAAVTLRLYLPASMVAGIDFTLAYPIIAWFCWVPNLIFAEWRYNTSQYRTGLWTRRCTLKILIWQHIPLISLCIRHTLE